LAYLYDAQIQLHSQASERANLPTRYKMSFFYAVFRFPETQERFDERKEF